MELLNLLQFSIFIKLFFAVLMLLYFVFTVVVYRQIVLMTQVLNSKISPLFKMIALGQVVAVGILFFLGILLV
ncbi:hypothetical protein M1403_02910 [Patescibacteria group bacterium]|nr:hypothetical protein [Patescibacteria group bacterium]